MHQDGAYFGTSFPHLLLITNPSLIPAKITERYVPKVFGFRVHSAAETHSKPLSSSISVPSDRERKARCSAVVTQVSIEDIS